MVARKERNESRTYKFVRLYRDDVDEIERTLLGLGPDPYSIEFNNGDWEAESIAELAAEGDGPFNEFRMQRQGPGLVAVEIQGWRTRLYVSNVDDLHLRGAFDKIGSLLTAAQLPRWTRWAYSAPAFAVVSSLGLAASIVALANGVRWARGSDIPPAWVSLACLATMGVACVVATHQTRTALRRNGRVYLVPKSARPSFLVRKRDDLAMLAIGTVVGVVVTLLITALTG